MSVSQGEEESAEKKEKSEKRACSEGEDEEEWGVGGENLAKLCK